MLITTSVPVEPGDILAPGSLDGCIGTPVTIGNDRTRVVGHIVAVEITDEGQSGNVTIETPAEHDHLLIS